MNDVTMVCTVRAVYREKVLSRNKHGESRESIEWFSKNDRIYNPFVVWTPPAQLKHLNRKTLELRDEHNGISGEDEGFAAKGGQRNLDVLDILVFCRRE